jgi:EAL domain-containing protein (putative c-di-GMP-specific phosphodiesterase class I)
LVKDGSAALSTAEVAARSAKERGGGRAVVFRDVDASVMQRRSDLDQVSNLQSAFIENRFILYAQTIQPLKEEEDSRRYEILVRMLDENGQLLLPAMFMSAAERYQMMIALDRWVINKTLDELANSDNMLEINLASFSINLSAQSLADDDFVDYLTQRIVESGVSPEALCFEITETALVRNLDRAQRFIRVLGNLGCRIALDDFGTGHCSFAYLKDMSVQYIKIDGVFIRDILDNPLSAAIVSSVTSIAKVMHAFTVAEHVENDKVLEHLRSHDIDFVQGFAIGRPRPLAEVIAEMGPAVLFDTTTNLVRSTS